MELPKCLKCNPTNDGTRGVLVPLSDYGQEGSTVMYKAWTCTEPTCGFTIRIDKGDVGYGKTNPNRH